jgi:diadenosine tetraphosphatase ApaH/serine/threonine PP2A family protein phosphatase
MQEIKKNPKNQFWLNSPNGQEFTFSPTVQCLYTIDSTHHAEGRVDPDDVAKKTVTGFRCPRACRIRKYQFENRSWEL